MARERKGIVFEREPGKWYARVTFTDLSGKRRDLWRKGENKTHAKELVKQLLRDLDDSADTVVEGNNTRFNEYLDRWLKTAAKPRLSERAYSDYQDLLRLYVRPTLGRKKLSDVRPLDVQSLYSFLQEEGGGWRAIITSTDGLAAARKQERANSENEARCLLKAMEQEVISSSQRIIESRINPVALSARTVRYTHAVLSSALKQAVAWGLIPRNPAQFVELPKQTREEMNALSPEMARRFLEAAATDKWAVLFQLALSTGMRPEEYLGLKWSDIDLDGAVVTIQRTLCWKRKGGGYYFGEPKTSRSRRSIPLPLSVRDGLIDHKQRQSKERMKAGPGYQALDLVFATMQGTPLMPRNLLRRHFKPMLERAKLPSTIRMYDLRHSCATLLLAAQENPKVVSERLGHASVTLTLDTYSHVLPSMQQAATDKLEQMLFARDVSSRARKSRKRAVA
jgi:integrase